MITKQSRFSQFSKAAILVATLSLSSFGAQARGMEGPMGGKGGGPDMMMAGRMEHMLDMVDASDAQRTQIKQIMDAAKQELKAQRAGGRNLHEQQMALFTATNIDAVAIEALRQQMSTQHEVASKRMSQAMVDAARVLTPEQRAKLAERMKRMQARMEGARAEHQAHPAH
jgi:Spy/CpxP family protein refolding chaperone